MTNEELYYLPASELLKYIHAEKERLIKEKVIKKQKELPLITDEEKPYELPEGWVWVRHNELFEISGGAQPPKSQFIDFPQNGYIRLFQIRDYGSNPQPIYIPIEKASKTSKKGDILLARYGASLGKVFIAEDGAYNVALAKVIPLFNDSLINMKFMYYKKINLNYL
jgi:type I restriction enzyme S subunit